MNNIHINNISLSIVSLRKPLFFFLKLFVDLNYLIESLNNEIDRMQHLVNEKDAHFKDLISVKEQYKRKLENNVEYSDYLKNVNLKLIDQINSLLKTKMIGKTI